MRFPEGYYWSYPGFPSYVVPYGNTSDFFFSGIRFLIFKNYPTAAFRTLRIFNDLRFGMVLNREKKTLFYNYFNKCVHGLCYAYFSGALCSR